MDYAVASVVLHHAHYIRLHGCLERGRDKRKSKHRFRPMIPNSHTNIQDESSLHV